MSRRDTILVAVLVNSALLALLFLTAIHTDLEVAPQSSPSSLAESSPLAQVVKPHQMEMSEPAALASTKEVFIAPLNEEVKEVATLPPSSVTENQRIAPEVTFKSLKNAQEDDYSEVIVKRGDFLARIARANGVSVNEIMKANHLDSHRLSIGQVLKIPKAHGAAANPAKGNGAIALQGEEKEKGQSLDAEYYTVQKGDNPWTIAKKNRVAFDELLRLNDLDEAKARNLKIGDRLRVR